MGIPGPKPSHGSRKDVLVRFPPEVLVRVTAWEKARGVTSRNDAIIQLIERGLGGGGPNQVLLPGGGPTPSERAAAERAIKHVKEVPIPRRTTVAHVTKPGSVDAGGHRYQVQLGPISRKVGDLPKKLVLPLSRFKLEDPQ